jgi:hypothetical protein
MSDHNKFSVLDMANSYASEQNVDVKELFKKPKKEPDKKKEPDVVEVKNEDQPKKKSKWVPDQTLIADMPDLKPNPLIYSKDEYKDQLDSQLSNLEDDVAIQNALDTMEGLELKYTNIELAKKRFGISKLQIPPGPFQVEALVAASDTNYHEAKKGLDEYFNRIIKEHPEFVLEWSDPTKNPANKNDSIINQESNNLKDNTGKIIDIPKSPEDIVEKLDNTESVNKDNIVNISENPLDAKIILDKSQLSEVSWTKEDMDKIKRARSIELNIKEDIDINYSQIVDGDEDNIVDLVLSQYQRKVNDIPGALPASKYRAIFSGLTYAEVLDLQYSQDLNNLDGEKKKWTIAFHHIKNPSIGPWQEYKFYINPDTKEKIILPINATAPNNIETTTVTKYEDFLKKTSFLDLNFILWKILCATAMDQEIVSINCKGTFNGHPCNKSYDWIYSPNELIDLTSINPAVLEELKKTSEVQTTDEIESNYKSSMLILSNTIELPSSKFRVVFGHASAYDYLDHIYGELKSLSDDDKIMMSDALARPPLMVIKYILIPREDGTFVRVKGYKNLEKILSTMDEIDWKTIGEIIKLMLDPYELKFSMRGVSCPQCHTRSDIPIEDVARILFMIAQNLDNTQVALKKV